MQLHQNEPWTISYYEAVSSVKIDWTDKTAHDFKDALSRFAGHAEEHSARCLLVNVQRCKPALSEEIGQWRDTAIIPRYNAVGIKRWGVLSDRMLSFRLPRIRRLRLPAPTQTSRGLLARVSFIQKLRQ